MSNLGNILHLLVPVDFQQSNQPALTAVRTLVESGRAAVKVMLIHSLQAPIMPATHLSTLEYYGTMFVERRAAAEAFLNELQTHADLAGCASVNWHLSDNVGLSIAELLAEQTGYDLLILQSRHRTGMDKWAVGSELNRILRRIPCPALCISDVPLTQAARFLFATDFSEPNIAALNEMAGLFSILGVSITVAYINTPRNFLTQRQYEEGCELFRQLVDANITIDRFLIYAGEEIATGVVHCAEDHLAQVVVLATRGRSGLSRLFSGSVTEDVLELTTLPLLVTRQPKENTVTPVSN